MSEPSAAAPTMPDTSTGGIQRTRLSPKWLAKTLIFLVVLFGFGCWGLYDATVVYPERGRGYAENAQRLYLRAAKEAGTLAGAGISDPAATYERVSDPATLRANRALEAEPSNPGHARAVTELKLYEWLQGLDRIGRLSPEHTQISDPYKTLDELDAAWSSRSQPKPLATWDLPVQWIFVVVGFGGGLALTVLFVRVRSLSYRWDPAPQRLFLPDGSSLVPADIAEFDKRKWDKFLVFLKIKPGHERHGGRELKLDLYRYVPLEEWILAMERTAFPEQAAPAPSPEQKAPEAPPGAEPDAAAGSA
jgi:hypothetical protein